MADETTSDEPSAEALDAAPTAPKPKPKGLKQRQKENREKQQAARPKPIDTPVNKIVSVKHTGKVGRVKIDNSKKDKGPHKGWVQITDSTGEGSEGWVRPGSLAEVEQKEKDAFAAAEKKSGGKPYYLGDDEDDSESDDGDEALDEPPLAKDVAVQDLCQSQITEMLRHVEGVKCARERAERAGHFAAVLADTSAKKADERAALTASIDAKVKSAWAKYEKHKAKHPELYSEEESEEESEDEEDYSGVPIDDVELADWVKEKFKPFIKKCVKKEADISWIEAMSSKQVRATHFKKALRDARGDSRDQKLSPRLAGGKAPEMPTISQPAESLVYSKSTEGPEILRQMMADAPRLRDCGTFVPTTGLAGCARRGGFYKGVGNGNALRFVGVPGPGFKHRFDGFAVHESDPLATVEVGLRIDLAWCFPGIEWKMLLPACVSAAQEALELLPASSSVEDQAKAVFGAYHRVVEEHEHETVWKSTFKAIDSVDGIVVLMASLRWRRVVGVASTASRRWHRVDGVALRSHTQVREARRDRRRRQRPKGALFGAGPTVSGLQSSLFPESRRCVRRQRFYCNC